MEPPCKRQKKGDEKQGETPSFPFILLPHELLVRIFSLVDLPDFLRLHSVSRFFNKFISKNANVLRTVNEESEVRVVLAPRYYLAFNPHPFNYASRFESGIVEVRGGHTILFTRHKSTDTNECRWNFECVEKNRDWKMVLPQIRALLEALVPHIKSTSVEVKVSNASRLLALADLFPKSVISLAYGGPSQMNNRGYTNAVVYKSSKIKENSAIVRNSVQPVEEAYLVEALALMPQLRSLHIAWENVLSEHFFRHVSIKKLKKFCWYGKWEQLYSIGSEVMEGLHWEEGNILDHLNLSSNCFSGLVRQWAEGIREIKSLQFAVADPTKLKELHKQVNGLLPKAVLGKQLKLERSDGVKLVVRFGGYRNSGVKYIEIVSL